MKKTRLITVILLIVSFASFSSEISHTFFLNLQVNKTKLYDYNLFLTSSPELVELTFNEDTYKFDTGSVIVTANTDIPADSSGVGFLYNLSVLSNESQCVSTVTDEITQSDIVELSVDGRVFDELTPLTGLGLTETSDSGYLFGTSNILLNSSVISERDMVQKCYGNIIIEAELTL